MNNPTLTKELIKVRAMSIICKDHPEWGTWGIMADNGRHLEILGNSGRCVLQYDELHSWEVVTKK